jgi:hypothetical protein
MGHFETGWMGYANVVLDEVRIWNVALPQSQIAGNRFNRLTGKETGLVGYWRLDERAGLTTADATPNGNNGTLVGGASWVDGAPAMQAATPYADYTVMTGKLVKYDGEEFDDGSQPIITLRGTDLFTWLDAEARLSSRVNTTTDVLIAAVLDAVGIDSTKRTINVGTGDLIGYLFGEGRTARAWLDGIVQFGYTHSIDRYGKYLVNGRVVSTPPPVGTITAVTRLLEESGQDGLVTRLRLVAHPWTQAANPAVVYTSGRVPFDLLPGETQTIRAEFRDQTLLVTIGVGSMVTPVATTDYTAQDVSLGDQTSKLQVGLVGSPGLSIDYTVTNTHTATITVTKLQLRGYPLTAKDTDVVEKSTGKSVYPDLFKLIDSDLIQTKAIADTVASYFATKFGDPRRRFTLDWTDVEVWNPTPLVADLLDFVQVQLAGGRVDPFVAQVRGIKFAFRDRQISYSLLVDRYGAAGGLTADLPDLEVWDEIF